MAVPQDWRQVVPAARWIALQHEWINSRPLHAAVEDSRLGYLAEMNAQNPTTRKSLGAVDPDD